MSNLPWRRKLKRTYGQFNISNFLSSKQKSWRICRIFMAQKIETNIRSAFNKYEISQASSYIHFIWRRKEKYNNWPKNNKIVFCKIDYSPLDKFPQAKNPYTARRQTAAIVKILLPAESSWHKLQRADTIGANGSESQTPASTSQAGRPDRNTRVRLLTKTIIS